MMRTYAGHSTARASNELYRGNLQKGQTGLSVAFDLPTQTGYDPDDELARGHEIANTIHSSGQAIVYCGMQEPAELYWEQLKGAGLTMAPLEQG